jgi:hypothetical protein
MRLRELFDSLEVPPSHAADVAWDIATRRVRRRRAARASVVSVAAVGALVAAIAVTRAGDGTLTPDPSQTATSPSKAEENAQDLVDGPDARVQSLAVDPNDSNRRAVLWWDCEACAPTEAGLALTHDAFATRTLVSAGEADSVTWAGDDEVAVVDLEAGTTELVALDGSRRPVQLGAESPAPTDASVVSAPVNGTVQPVWIDAAEATAHPLPLPEKSAGAIDQTVWRDANGLMWFGRSDDDNVVAKSNDGGASWTSHSLGTGHMEPVYSGAPDVMAVLEYETAESPGLRLRAAHFSLDNGRTWNETDPGSMPTAPVASQGGVVRADGRLLVTGPICLLMTTDRSWNGLEPVFPPDDQNFELLSFSGSGSTLKVIAGPIDGSTLYESGTLAPTASWSPFASR